MKAIHYINQFFAGIGGEEKADQTPVFHDKLIGCSMMLNDMCKPDIEVTNTIVCGDNYITNHTEEALKEIFAFLDTKEFGIFFAGPAFMAGRYGVGCGIICKAVAERYHVPVITSMNEENPGVEEYKAAAYIFKGGRKATFMKQDVTPMAAFAKKIAKGEELLPAAQEGYFPRGIRMEIPEPNGIMAADRVIDMLLKKINGEPFQTELIIPSMEKIPPAAPLKDLSKATIALVSSSGVVPVYKTIHAGFDPAAMCAVPDRGIPLDAMRYFEKQGKIGKVYDWFYVTVGTGTTQAFAAKFGREIAKELHEAGVDAVILTST